MSWVRIDDQAPRHRKLRKVSHAARWLWLCGLAHCQSQLTDGFIDEQDLGVIGFDAPCDAASERSPSGTPSGVRAESALTHAVQMLLDVHLWRRVEGGYVVHDYLEYNAARKDVLRRKSVDAKRKRRSRPSGVRAESDAPSERSPTVPSHPIPSCITTTEKGEDGAHGKATTIPPKAGTKRPMLTLQRLVLFEWMIDELMRLLGNHAAAFGLDEWLDTADSIAMEMPARKDWWPWLQAETLAEMKRRGLPVASATDAKKSSQRAAASVGGPSLTVWDTCPHDPVCDSTWRCEQKTVLDAARAEREQQPIEERL